MTVYSKFLDTPNGIVVEGQEISLTFIRTSNTTGTLNWNVPMPQAGCATPGAYNGIVLTVSSQPANYRTTSPVNGTYYTADPSVDPDLNMAPTLGNANNTALVVGAFYNDTTTTTLNVTDLQPLTAYYFSAYAVDNVARYHSAGVHSYSLPSGPERPNHEKNLPAIQDVGIEWSQSLGTNCLTPHSWTGLKEGQQYALTMLVDGTKYRMGIDGATSLDYQSLIRTINSEFIRLTPNKYSAPYPATANRYYVNVANETVVSTSVIANVTNITTSINAVITVNTISTVNPFTNFTMINVNGVTSMLQNDNVYGNILSLGGASGAWTLTTDINTTSLPAYTSGGIVYSGWDGTVPQVVPCLFDNSDPSTPHNGHYWYDPVTNVLSEWAGLWTPVNFLTSNYDFSDPACYDYWFNGVNAYEWEKVLWCQLPTYVQTTNPLLPPVLDCNTFWYNTVTLLLSQWDEMLQTWDPVNAIYADIDPNTIATGEFWLNTTLNQVYYRAGSVWNLLTVSMVDNVDGAYPGTTFANMYWFDPSTNLLYKRDAANTIWVQKDIVLFATDPTDRASCGLWWDSVNDTLYIWDIVNTRWVKVSQFWQQAVDPSALQDIPLNSAWYNPATQVLTIINNPDCSPVNFVYDTSDPTIMSFLEIWFNPTTQVWNRWMGTGWNIINVITLPYDPYALDIGTLWFDPAASQLNRWAGGEFESIPYSTSPLVPVQGTLWCNTVNGNLYSWNNITGLWDATIGVAAAKLVLRNKHGCDRCNGTGSYFDTYNSFGYYYDLNDGWPVPFDRDFIRFYTNVAQCCEKIELCWNDNGYGPQDNFTAFETGQLTTSPNANPPVPNQNLLFANLGPMIYFRPQKGYTALSSPPTYQQLGVGTDGDPAERREMHAIIRSTLGDPSKKVELTKEQLNICINNSLKMLRKNSSLSYRRELFFLDVFPCQQQYLLKDECVGFNKIVDVAAIYRCRGSFFGGNGVYGDGLFAWSALQQLYSLGTFDTLSFHLVSSYVKDLQILFADNIIYEWIETTRQLKMYKSFYAWERVLIDAYIERTEQDLLLDRQTTMWLQRWAIAEAKLQLAQVRGAFVTLPGPNGNVTMNAQDLIAQAQQEMQMLEEELHDPVNQSLETVGLKAHMVWG